MVTQVVSKAPVSSESFKPELPVQGKPAPTAKSADPVSSSGSSLRRFLSETKTPTPEVPSSDAFDNLLKMIALLSELQAKLSTTNEQKSLDQLNFLKIFSDAVNAENTKKLQDMKTEEAAEAQKNQTSLAQRILGYVFAAVSLLVAAATGGVFAAIAMSVIFLMQNIPTGNDNTAMGSMFDGMGIHGHWQILATVALCVAVSGLAATGSGLTAGASSAVGTGVKKAAEEVMDIEMTEITEANPFPLEDASEATEGSSASQAALSTLKTALPQTLLSTGVIQQSIVYAAQEIGGKDNLTAEIIGTVVAVLVTIAAAILAGKIAVNALPESEAAEEGGALSKAKAVLRSPKLLIGSSVLNGIGSGVCHLIIALAQLKLYHNTNDQGDTQKALTLLMSLQEFAAQAIRTTAREGQDAAKAVLFPDAAKLALPYEYIAEALA